jgi:cob(I)alamin adenosyltransferase
MSGKIYTKTGDAGQTGLFSGERISKTDPLIAACGTVDELSSHLGAALAARPSQRVAEVIAPMQNLLIELAADLATLPGSREIRRVGSKDIERLEKQIDETCSQLPPLHEFLPPGGTPAAAQIHIARTVARRAEREALCASATHPLNHQALVFLNRLSDLLFVLARMENALESEANALTASAPFSPGA